MSDNTAAPQDIVVDMNNHLRFWGEGNGHDISLIRRGRDEIERLRAANKALVEALAPAKLDSVWQAIIRIGWIKDVPQKDLNLIRALIADARAALSAAQAQGKESA